MIDCNRWNQFFRYDPSFNMFSKSILEHRKKRNDRFNSLWEIILLKEKEKKRNKYVQSVQKFDHLIHLFFDPSTKVLFANLVTRKRIQLPKKKKKETCSKVWLLIYLWTIRRFTNTKEYPVSEKILPKRKKRKHQKQSESVVFQTYTSFDYSSTKVASKYRMARNCVHSSYQIVPILKTTLILHESVSEVSEKFLAKKKGKKEERIQIRIQIPATWKSLTVQSTVFPEKFIERFPATKV